MQQIYAKYTASITELKKSPSKLLEKSNKEPVAILNHNKPMAYLISSEIYERMMDIIDDFELSKEIEKRLNDGEKPIKVDINELLS